MGKGSARSKITDDHRYCDALERYGTPLYVYDRRILRERIELLRKSLPKGIELCYAVKANTFIIRELDELVDAFEICSPGEAQICYRLGIAPEKMVISGVYKTPKFIDELVSEGGEIRAFTVESQAQYEMLKSLAWKHRKRLRLLFRLTSGNQFGEDKDVVVRLLKDAAGCPDLITIVGVQFFSGTQKTSVKKLKRELEKVDSFVTELREVEQIHIEEVEFGPGIPAMYFEEEDFDEGAYFEDFSRLLMAMENKVHMTFEIGRGIAATCGTYFTRVVDAKVNKGERYAIVDGGMNHLVYYGQTMAIRIPEHEIISERPRELCSGEGSDEKWNICGALCSVNDILVKQLDATGLGVGDVLAFKNAGAYCVTEGMSLFLSRALPAVVILREDGTCVKVREQQETSWLNCPDYDLEK